MLFKKSTFLIAVVSASLSSFAVALPSLITVNNSSQFSSVKLDNGKCTGALGKFTHPGETLETKGLAVQSICGATKGNCGASIIVANNEDSVRRCEGETIGHATIDLATIKVGEPSGTRVKRQGDYTLIVSN